MKHQQHQQHQHQQSESNTPPEVTAKKKPVRSIKKQHGAVGSQPATDGDGHEEMIRQTAYFLYEARSCEAGHELDDWLQAETQLAEQAQVAQSPEHAT